MATRRRPLHRVLVAGLAIVLCPLLAGTAIAGLMARQSAWLSAENSRATTVLATTVSLQQALTKAEALEASPQLYAGDKAARQAFAAAADNAVAAFDRLAGQVEPSSEPAVAQGRAAFVKFRDAALGVADLFVAGGDVRRTASLSELLRELGTRLQESADALGLVYDAVRAQVSLTTERVKQQQHREAEWLAGAALGGALLGIVAITVFHRRLVRPLDHLRSATEQAGDDGLPAEIPVSGHREIAEVAEAFNGMVQRLAESRAALAGREAWFRLIVQHSSDLLLVVNDDGTIREVAGVMPVTDWEPGRLVGRSLLSLLETSSASSVGQLLRTIAAQPPGARVVYEPLDVRLALPGGSRLLELLVSDLRAEAVGGLVLTGRDVTQRSELAEQLHHLANHDELTGLANRKLFRLRLAEQLHRPDRGPVAVLYIDMDQFKQINDSLGHASGDTYLAEVAARILRTVRPDDLAARLGGDEFAVLLSAPSGHDEASRLAARLHDTLAHEVELAGRVVQPSASIGIAVAEQADRHSPDTLLAQADEAMYLAKARRAASVPHDRRPRASSG